MLCDDWQEANANINTVQNSKTMYLIYFLFAFIISRIEVAKIHFFGIGSEIFLAKKSKTPRNIMIVWGL